MSNSLTNCVANGLPHCFFSHIIAVVSNGMFVDCSWVDSVVHCKL